MTRRRAEDADVDAGPAAGKVALVRATGNAWVPVAGIEADGSMSCGDPTPKTTASLETLERVRRQVHPACVVCSPDCPHGLQLNFTEFREGQLVGQFDCSASLEGYPGRLQGGVVASLMDGVMANCLFAHGVVAVTTELTVRYRQPVASDVVATLCAEIIRTAHGVSLMKAELRQHGQTCATATAKFFAQPELFDNQSATR